METFLVWAFLGVVVFRLVQIVVGYWHDVVSRKPGVPLPPLSYHFLAFVSFLVTMMILVLIILIMTGIVKPARGFG